MKNNGLTLLLIIDNSLLIDINFAKYDNVREYCYLGKTFNFDSISKSIYNKVSSIQNVENQVNYENLKKEIIELIKKEVQATFLAAEQNIVVKNENVENDYITSKDFYEEIFPDIEFTIDAIYWGMDRETSENLSRVIKEFDKKQKEFDKKQKKFEITMKDIIESQEAAKAQLDDLNEIKGQIFTFVGTIISAIAVLGVDIKFSANMFENFVRLNSGGFVLIYFFGSQGIFIFVLGGLIWFILNKFNKKDEKGSKDLKDSNGSKDLKDSNGSKDLK
jgi:hypothetical protein